jgi:hypothetical protein
MMENCKQCGSKVDSFVVRLNPMTGSHLTRVICDCGRTGPWAAGFGYKSAWDAAQKAPKRNWAKGLLNSSGSGDNSSKDLKD